MLLSPECPVTLKHTALCVFRKALCKFELLLLALISYSSYHYFHMADKSVATSELCGRTHVLYCVLPQDREQHVLYLWFYVRPVCICLYSVELFSHIWSTVPLNRPQRGIVSGCEVQAKPKVHGFGEPKNKT